MDPKHSNVADPQPYTLSGIAEHLSRTPATDHHQMTEEEYLEMIDDLVEEDENRKLYAYLDKWDNARLAEKDRLEEEHRRAKQERLVKQDRLVNQIRLAEAQRLSLPPRSVPFWTRVTRTLLPWR